MPILLGAPTSEAGDFWQKYLTVLKSHNLILVTTLSVLPLDPRLVTVRRYMKISLFEMKKITEFSNYRLTQTNCDH